VTTMQWSRRFLGLRLFLSLAAAGWAGYGDHVERAIELIALLKEKLVARDGALPMTLRSACCASSLRRGSAQSARSSTGSWPRAAPGWRRQRRGARNHPDMRDARRDGPGDIDELVNTLCQ